MWIVLQRKQKSKFCINLSDKIERMCKSFFRGYVKAKKDFFFPDPKKIKKYKK